MKKTQIETLTDQLFSMEANQPLLINELEPYVELFMHYECAMLEIETKLNVFDKEFSLHGESNPIESVSTRLKTPLSLMNKLKRLNLPFDIDTIKNNITCGKKDISNKTLETQVLIYNNLLKNENISVILISHNIIDDLSFDDTIYINKSRVKQYSMVQ